MSRWMLVLSGIGLCDGEASWTTRPWLTGLQKCRMRLCHKYQSSLWNPHIFRHLQPEARSWGRGKRRLSCMVLASGGFGEAVRSSALHFEFRRGILSKTQQMDLSEDTPTVCFLRNTWLSLDVPSEQEWRVTWGSLVLAFITPTPRRARGSSVNLLLGRQGTADAPQQLSPNSSDRACAPPSETGIELTDWLLTKTTKSRSLLYHRSRLLQLPLYIAHF